MNFNESLEYLYNLGNEVLAMKLGLENIRKVLDALGNPHKNYSKVQVAGTNGKGSTCAFLESICVAAGIPVGMTTSPHLISITERVKINGQEISEKDFARHATRIREISEKLVERGELETVPTYFEQVTAIALNAFAEAKVELAILETGLGGRFDATTAANAEIVAITPVDYDHQNILGNSLAEIAAEKAAIIHTGVKAVIAPQKKEAMQVIQKQCAASNVSPVVNNCQYFEEDFPEISFKTSNEFYPHIRFELEGEHQYINACVAINLAEILHKDFGFPISRYEIIDGLQKTKHKGRLEWYFEDESRFLFDGAHNIAGVEALRNYLQRFYSDSKITIVFGMMRDKNLDKIAEILFPLAENLILTKPDNPRSENLEELKKYAEKFIDKSKVFSVENVADAIDSAKQITLTYSRTKHSFICITGSLYLVGEAQKILKDKDA